MSSKKRNNATASWNGYNHQGKVGLLVSLTQIHDLIKNLPPGQHQAALAGWQLVYEHPAGEDFDIVDHSQGIVSAHQVKAKHRSCKRQADYKDIVGVVADNGKIKSTFATARPNGKTVPQDGRFLHVTHNMAGGWSMDPSDNPCCIQLYAYPDGKNYIDPGRQSDLIDFCLQHIALLRPELTDNDRQKMTFLALADALDAKIYTAHQPLGTGPMEYPKLTLAELYDIVQKDHFDSHMLTKQRALFYRYWEDLREALEHEPPAADAPEMDWAAWHEADRLIQQIARDDAFLESLKIIHPHKPTVHNDWDMSEPGLRDVYFTVLRQVNKDFDIRNHRFIRLNKTYALTAIETAHEYSVAAGIVRNVQNNNFRFETDYAINKELSVTLGEIDNTQNIIGTLAPVQGNYEDSRAKQESIMALKNIQFIKVAQAVTALKEQV